MKPEQIALPEFADMEDTVDARITAPPGMSRLVTCGDELFVLGGGAPPRTPLHILRGLRPLKLPLRVFGRAGSPTY